MMMKSKSITMMALLVATTYSGASAQRVRTARQRVKLMKTAEIYKVKSEQIVNDYKQRLGGIVPQSEVADSLLDMVSLSPSLFRLLGPGVYYRSAVSDKFSIDYPLLTDSASTSVVRSNQWLCRSIDDVLTDGYVNYPSLFRYTDDRIAKEEVIADASLAIKKTVKDLEHIYKKAEEIKDVKDIVSDVDVNLKIVKPNFWATKCNFELQFAQNYFSEKWYKGGNNNVNLYTRLYMEANYNDQKSIQWDNSLEMRLGFVTATSDSIHRYLTNNDRIRLYSKLGVKAAKNWYYSLSAEGLTQLLPGYRSNDRRTYSDFLAPLDATVAIGIDFKPKLKKGSFSAEIAPLTYKIRYIALDDETIHNSYNMHNRDFKQDFGSKLVVNSNITLAKNFTWRSRYYFFTSYEYVESEWENVLSFRFNKYITSEVNSIWRFDDNRDKRYVDSTLGYFQFKESFTLGLSYYF